SSAAHCGGCGKACPGPPHQEVSCVNSACMVGGCIAGFRDCNNNPGDGCEVDLQNDPTNCGDCAKVCPAGANAAAACGAGLCTLNCKAGFGDCNKDPVDGCEADTTADAKNCGACGKACNNNEMCRAGVCVGPMTIEVVVAQNGGLTFTPGTV